ncbi:MAG: AraC family transcriptional regulator ligand-binding domain-containing protein [Polyangiales bacterium]
MVWLPSSVPHASSQIASEAQQQRSVPLFMLRAIWDELSKRGVSPAALERASGLALPQRGDFHSSAPLRDVHRLFEAATALSGDPALGLSVGRALHTTSFHLVGHLALASDSLAQVSEAARRALPALSHRPPLLSALDDEHLRFGFLNEPALTPGARFEAELTAVLLQELTLHFLHASFRTPTIQLPFAAPASTGPYRAFFAGAVEFDASGTFVVFPRRAQIRRRSGSDPGLAEQLLQLARAHYGDVGDEVDWTARVRRALRTRAAPRLVDAEALARELDLPSARALTRRLAREGTRVSSLIDEALYQRAQALLRRPGTTATEVSATLGYAELSSFFRAFRRWSGGRPPSTVRDRDVPSD